MPDGLTLIQTYFHEEGIYNCAHSICLNQVLGVSLKATFLQPSVAASVPMCLTRIKCFT